MESQRSNVLGTYLDHSQPEQTETSPSALVEEADTFSVETSGSELVAKSEEETNNEFLIRALESLDSNPDGLKDSLLTELEAGRLSPNSEMRRYSPHYSPLFAAIALSNNASGENTLTLDDARRFVEMGEIPQTNGAWRRAAGRLTPEVYEYLSGHGMSVYGASMSAFRASNFELMDYLASGGEILDYSSELFENELNNYKRELFRADRDKKSLARINYLVAQGFVSESVAREKIEKIDNSVICYDASKKRNVDCTVTQTEELDPD